MFYGYARVSTTTQHDTSIDVQLEYLKKQAETLGETFKPLYEKVSGKLFEERSVFKSLIDNAKEGDIIGIYDDSRFGRETGSNLDYLEQLSKKGVRLFDAGRFIDYNNPIDKMIFTVGSAFATYQREIQLKKSKEGISRTKENGDWILRGDLFGYTLTTTRGKTTASIDETAAYYIRYIFNAYSRGRSALSISTELQDITFKDTSFKLNASVVRRMLYKPIYMGYYTRDSLGKKLSISKMSRKEVEEQLIKSNIYPPIVSEELWWSCFESHRKVNRKHAVQYEYRQTPYELTGIIKSKCCGKGFVHSFDKSNYKTNYVTEYYMLNAHTKDCNNRNYKRLNKDVVEFVMRVCFLITFSTPSETGMFFSEQKALISNSIEELEKQVSLINNNISDIDRKMNNLINLASEGIDISLFKGKLMELKEERSKLEKELRNVQDAISIQQGDFEDLILTSSEEIVDNFIHFDSENRRDLYKKFCNAYSDNKELIIEYENGKKFEVHWYEGRAKSTVKPITFKMSFRGEEQETGTLLYKTKSVKFDNVEEVDLFRKWVNEQQTKFSDKIEKLIAQM